VSVAVRDTSPSSSSDEPLEGRKPTTIESHSHHVGVLEHDLRNANTPIRCAKVLVDWLQSGSPCSILTLVHQSSALRPRSTPTEGAMGPRFETPTPTTNTREMLSRPSIHQSIDVRVPRPRRRNTNINTTCLSCLSSNRVGCDQEDKTRETNTEPNKSDTSSRASDEATTRRRDKHHHRRSLRHTRTSTRITHGCVPHREPPHCRHRGSAARASGPRAPSPSTTTTTSTTTRELHERAVGGAEVGDREAAMVVEREGVVRWRSGGASRRVRRPPPRRLGPC